MTHYIDNWFAEEMGSSSEIALAMKAVGDCSSDLVINRSIEDVMGDYKTFRDFLRCKRTIAKSTRDAFDPEISHDWWGYKQWEVRRAEMSAIQSAFEREWDDPETAALHS
jgi:hypothetical protein